MKNPIEKGFTLIELMIVVAIIAILGAIAFPSYQDQVRKTRRASAKAGLMELASYMERTFTENNAYNNAAAAVTLTDSGITNDNYTLSISVLTATTYTLTVVPAGGQAADGCGTMTLTHTGVKAHTGAEAGCW